MKIGIIGPAGCGKTTLFKALTGGSATEAKPGQVGIGTVKVPDPRLEKLREMYSPKKYTPASVEYLDFPGIFGAERVKGRGGTGDMISQLRQNEALACVVGGHLSPDPETWPSHLNSLKEELALMDLEVMEKRIEKLEKSVLKPSVTQKQEQRELELLRKCLARLEQGQPFGDVVETPADRKMLTGYAFFLMKPLIGVVNLPESVSPDVLDGKPLPEGYAAWLALCATVEQEISELPESERGEYLSAMGIREPASHRFIRESYDALGLISFFTVGEDEVRAWTLRKGADAVEAAGTIHSDLAKGFIRAEVISYDDLVAAGSLKEAKTKGTLRLEGKEYVVQNGDIVHIRFST